MWTYLGVFLSALGVVPPFSLNQENGQVDGVNLRKAHEEIATQFRDKQDGHIPKGRWI